MSLGTFTRQGDSTLTMSEYEDEKRKRRLWMILAAVVVVIIVVIVVLALTVFKARAPRVQINSVDLETFSIGADSLNMSLLLDLTVHNPNRVSFKYAEGVTQVVYSGVPVGEAVIPAGGISSRGYEYLSVLLFLDAARLLVNENLPVDVLSGRLPVVATTTLAGTVTILGVFKHHAVATSDCEISVFVTNATLENFYCHHSVKL